MSILDKGSLPPNTGSMKVRGAETRSVEKTSFLSGVASTRVFVVLIDPRCKLSLVPLQTQKEQERLFADILAKKRRRDAKNDELRERLERYRQIDPSVETLEDLAKKAPYYPDGRPYYGSPAHLGFARAFGERVPALKKGAGNEQEWLQRAMMLAPFGGSGIAMNPAQLDPILDLKEEHSPRTGEDVMKKLGIRKKRRSEQHHVLSHLDTVLEHRVALMALEIDHLAGTLYGIGPMKELYALGDEPFIEKVCMGSALHDPTIPLSTRLRVIEAFHGVEDVPNYTHDLQKNGWAFQDAA
jgi:hypothetical protein